MKQFREIKSERGFKSLIFFHMKTILVLIPVALLASGCSEGRFLDSAVEGLEYETETQSGVTDKDGTFLYMDGETVMFHIGGVVLGQAIAKPLMTPVDLVDGATDETHPVVTNMARLLQTMDADMNPENGITITGEMTAAIADLTIDFSMDPDNFEHDPEVQMFMNTLNDLNPSGPMRMMVSAEDAQDHLYNTMMDMADMGMMGGDTGMMSSDSGMMR